MGYALLGIENLAVALLFVATGTALVARLRNRWLRLALAAVFAVVPLVGYGLRSRRTLISNTTGLRRAG